MKLRHALTVLLGVLTFAIPASAFSEAPTQETRTARGLTVEVGPTIVAGNYPRVEPAPGLGAGLLLERRWFGVEGGGTFAPLARCHYVEVLQRCGSVWMLHAAGRVTVKPQRRWSPYLSVRLDLVYAQRNAFGLQYQEATDSVLVPAVGPRAGVRFRGERAGLFVELGPSFMPSGLYGDCIDCAEGRPTWWVFQVSTGFTWSWTI